MLRRLLAPLAEASMRPRVFPAEDLAEVVALDRAYQGFNEAAGIPRGRQPWHELERVATHASMRPRVFPAEDADAVSGTPATIALQ